MTKNIQSLLKLWNVEQETASIQSDKQRLHVKWSEISNRSLIR
jgi:hypothetical protein